MTVLTHRTLLVTSNVVLFRDSLNFNEILPGLSVYLFAVYLTKLPEIQEHVYVAMYHCFVIFVAPKKN